ncbi:hypothetical protein MOK15_13610 [Sphingobium sp. BYY-5]|uniref:hypothetical protein n=1 Tax=Sphingobium sp. BYY-5 TaxID=2926400 RepID=UPI001FA6F195|nr:hypothetical protein [Sphingobium sp. BYY-5]MCI4591124.1 hypothetical protein [Sphingobium sp. BYY-5]
MTASKNRYELRQYLRFQLEQMSAKNQQHHFEELAFELARQTISRRIVPATGPVQAGGDQGRDFESYRTYLASTPIASSLSVAAEGTDTLVFGCTLDKALTNKIKRDLRSMFGGTPKPTVVYYYAVPDLPVAKRHNLQKLCHDAYGAHLEVFDGQAIADLLAEPETFWIAEQFLSVPADMFPAVEADADYAALRRRWFDEVREIGSYSDFIEVKRGLRRATFSPELRADLGLWSDLLKETLGKFGPVIERKALYEIAVAQLRGRGSLDPAVWAVSRYFEMLDETSPPNEVEDATVLASYAVSARLRGEFNAAPELVEGWREKARAAIERSLAEDINDGSRYRLLLVRGHLDFDELGTADVDERAERLLLHWEAAAKIAAISPFADIDALAGLLEMVLPIIGDHARYRDLADQVDAIVAERGGKFTAAEQGRNRAVQYLKADKVALAVDQLQRAKDGWFSAETMRGSVLAMLNLAECYALLHLPLASRYYAAAALHLAGRSDDESLRPLVAEAAFLVADSYMLNGEGLSYLAAFGGAAALHMHFATDPEELERHAKFSAGLVQATQMRTLLVKNAPHLEAAADAIVDGWKLDPAYANSIRQLGDKPPWATMSLPEIAALLAEQLGQGLFGDVGGRVQYQWHALGINWSIEAAEDARLDAGRFGAALQIALVDLSDRDLLIIPSDVHVRIETGSAGPSSLRQDPDNGTLRFIITLPEGGDQTEEVERTFAMTATMVAQATALPFVDFRTILDGKMERGLMTRAFWVQPVSALLKDVRDLLIGDMPDLSQQHAPALAIAPALVHPDLAWRSTPAPGYSREKSIQALENRYRRTGPVMLAIVPLLMGEEKSRDVLQACHAEGMPDWQLCNCIYNFTLNAAMEEELGGPLLGGTPDAQGVMNRAIKRIENGAMPKVDLAKFDKAFVDFQLGLNTLATLKGWGLQLHRQTPNSIATKRFLDARYMNSSDDIDHEDVFGWNAAA